MTVSKSSRKRKAANRSPGGILARLIANPPKTSVVIDVTLQVAQAMMDLNTHNRPKRNATTKRYGDEMTGGRWMQTGVPLIFSKTGEMLDGQHRIDGVIASGVAQEFHCVFGIDDAAFNFIDRGANRTAGDIFAINGVPNWDTMAASIRWIWSYYAEKSEGSHAWGAGACKLLPDELYALYLDHTGLQNSCQAGAYFKNMGLAPYSVMVAMHYLCAKKSATLADDFFQQAATGTGTGPSLRPARQLHKMLIKNAGAQQKYDTVQHAIYIIRAWNTARKHQAKFQVSIDSRILPRIR